MMKIDIGLYNKSNLLRLLFAFTLLAASIISTPFELCAQTKYMKGVVMDKQSDEPIPFASAKFIMSGRGVLTDSSGTFLIPINSLNAADTLAISSVGYKVLKIPYSYLRDSDSYQFKIEVLPPKNEAIVKAKYNRALWFWKRIMKYKPIHEKRHWDNYSYEIYNKLEVDLQNLNKEKLTKNRLLKPLNFVFDYIDSTSEEKPFLPAYITETLSDYYFQRDPRKVREVIKATRTNGIDNESVIKQLGGLYQNINIYDNFIPVFNRQFISPFNDNGSNYYTFKLLDTQYLSNRRLIHFKFIPKRPVEDVFTGDCWVHDTSYSIQKITLRPTTESNINFISGLSLIQEFRLVNDSVWFLYKDKFVADITPIGGKRLGLKGRKTTTYKNVVLNSKGTIDSLSQNKKSEEVKLVDGYMKDDENYWIKNRHEDLSKSERSVYKLLDTLTKNPTFIAYRNFTTFALRGTKDIGNFRIGPWFYWASANAWESYRFRFDISTNKGFDKRWNFHTYLAYGTKDNVFKGKAEVKYLYSREPWAFFNLSYRNDLDNGQQYYDQLGTDNVFATIFRHQEIPTKFQTSEETRLDWFQETNNGYGFGAWGSRKLQRALQNLPGKEYFQSFGNNQAFNNFETGVKFRYSYLERTIEDNFNLLSLGSDRPIIEIRYAHGWNGVYKSNYVYDKVEATLADYINVSPYGTIYYNLFGGNINGTLPYNLLQIMPGNELYYYNRYAFNLMNRFEFIGNTYGGINVEHNLGGGIFKYIPLTRKLRLRQFWEAKAVTATLSDEDKRVNFIKGFNYPYKSLDGKVYVELGTGIDNILNLFRLDLIWRVAPTPQAGETVRKFGVFGSFRFSF